MNFLIVLLLGSDSIQCPLVAAELWTVRRRPPFGRIYVPKTITFDKIFFLNSSVIFPPMRGLLFYLIRLNFLFAVLTAYRFTRNDTRSSEKWETFQLNVANLIHGRLRWYAPYARNSFALFATFSLCFQCLLCFLATFYRQLYSGNTQWRDSCGRYVARVRNMTCEIRSFTFRWLFSSKLQKIRLRFFGQKGFDYLIRSCAISLLRTYVYYRPKFLNTRLSLIRSISIT